MPNLVDIGQPVTEISRFFDFQDGGLPSAIVVFLFFRLIRPGTGQNDHGIWFLVSLPSRRYLVSSVFLFLISPGNDAILSRVGLMEIHSVSLDRRAATGTDWKAAVGRFNMTTVMDGGFSLHRHERYCSSTKHLSERRHRHRTMKRVRRNILFRLFVV